MFKSNDNNNLNNKSNKENNMKDKAFEAMNENKIERSVRNMKALGEALVRAKKGDFDIDVSREEVRGVSLLKVHERFTIRKMFSIEQGSHYYKLYKEVFYIVDPQKYYYEDFRNDNGLDKEVFRRISAQHEQGDLEWAKAVSEALDIEIVEE